MNAGFKRRRTRIGALTLALAALFGLAAIRLTVLVLSDGPRLASMARSEHTAVIDLAAVRGPIVDRNGKPLALSAETQSVYARPRKLLEDSTGADRAELARLLGLKPADLDSRLHRGAPFVWLARHLPPRQAGAALDLGLDGIGAVSEYKRFYPESNLAGSVVGMAGMDGQGLSGVELQYDKLVRGEPVELRFYHDALGHPIFDSPMELKSAEPGARLELTIDATIQAEAENYLAEQVKRSGARRGAAVVLEPFTGEVLALANVAADRSGTRARLHDVAVQDVYEPGSTMKGILGAIALQDHVIDPSREIFCENGEWRVGGRMIHDDSRHQWLNLGGIIEVSSNIGAAKIALMLGARRYYEGLRAFGIGSRTGIDLPGEARGLLRSPSSWREIELADHGFGQGIAVTPIQMASAYAAIANGGVVMRPYVLKAAYDASGREILAHTPQALRRAVSPDVAHEMNLLLRNVVNGRDGTAHLAQVSDYVVAGKTGTAQMVDPSTGRYYQSRLVASFVGFLPADDPRLVILVVLYDVAHGHFGGMVAAPVFREIASGALRRLDIAPVHPAYDTAGMLPFGDSAPAPADEQADDRAEPAELMPVAMSARSGGGTPDFRGLSLRGALALARDDGLGLEVTGSGYVSAQDPAPGMTLNRGAVRIALSDDG
ncbi:MAG TPA: penicillin-binding protein, partial [Candidatus Binataceae bacterium]|nr:penicillin-binding protein [Candidatus Binataceae bacterium]